MAAVFQERVVASEGTRIICLDLDPSMSLVTSAATSSLDSFGGLRILRLILTRMASSIFQKRQRTAALQDATAITRARPRSDRFWSAAVLCRFPARTFNQSPNFHQISGRFVTGGSYPDAHGLSGRFAPPRRASSTATVTSSPSSPAAASQDTSQFHRR
jgi:hypothetical protein